jgi:hypothetical protein
MADQAGGVLKRRGWPRVELEGEDGSRNTDRSKGEQRRKRIDRNSSDTCRPYGPHGRREVVQRPIRRPSASSGRRTSVVQGATQRAFVEVDRLIQSLSLSVVVSRSADDQHVPHKHPRATSCPSENMSASRSEDTRAASTLCGSGRRTLGASSKAAGRNLLRVALRPPRSPRPALTPLLASQA